MLSLINNDSYKQNLKSALDTFAENYKNSLNSKIELSKKIENLGLQAPLQTDCGRYVTIWLLAIVNGIDFKKLDNYPTLFEPLINLAKTRFFEGEKYTQKLISPDNLTKKMVHACEILE